MYEFETFERTNAHMENTRPAVTLTKRKTLSFNRRAVEVLGGATTVELLYDRKKQVIGIKPVKEETPNSYTLRRSKEGSVFIVALGAFANKYKIATEQSRRYLPDLFDGVMVIDITKPVSTVVGQRGGKS